MSRNVNDVIRTLNSARRKRVEARAAELIAEEMTLQELRRARKLTQVSVAKALPKQGRYFEADTGMQVSHPCDGLCRHRVSR